MKVSNEGYESFTAYAATYGALAGAEADFAAVQALKAEEGVLGLFDAAILSRDDTGKVKIVKKYEEPTKHATKAGGKIGLAAGLAAVLLPGVGLGVAVVGAGVGAALGHMAGHAVGGLSKSDIKELGETLEAGQSALVLVVPTPSTERVTAAITHADTVESRVLGAEEEVGEGEGEPEGGTAYPASPTAM